MKTTKYILTIVLALVCVWSNSFAVDQSYYSSIDGKSGKNLFDAVHSVAKTGYKSLSYNGLWTAYCAIDLNSSGKVWDMYSNATSYTCGGPEEGANYTKEGDAYNREHSIPKNWFGGSDASNTPGTDLFHVVPTDGYVNNIRSAYAFGEVASASYTSKSGCKKGTPKSITVSNSLLNKSGSSTQSCSASTVFEPIDEYKGDFARGYFGTMIKWANGDYQTFTTAEGAQIFNTFYDAAHYYGLKAYGVALLLKWHREDPVSQKEIDRNNGIQNKQGNRNPFIDYPELVEYIWGEHCNEAVTLSSLTPTFEGYTPPAATTYTVILSRNGVTEAVSGLTGTYNLPASSSNACEGWTFAGWSATKVTSTTSTPSFVTSVTNGGTYYAVYSKTTASSAPRKAATVGTTLWAEDFSGYSNGDVPSGTISNSHTGTTIYNSGSVSYSVTNGSGTTKVYNENLATGTAPELLIAKSGGSFSISGIPTGNATAMTLTFKTNQTSNISVSSGTTGITVGSVSISSNTATCEITNDDAAAFNLTITKNNGGNSREDNFLLAVKTAGSGGGGGGTTYDSEPTDCNCSGKLGTPNVTATPGDGKITLTWDDVTDATNGYSVTISKGVGYTTECGDLSIGEITHSGTTNTCVISGLVNGLEYTTSVIANETATTCDSDPDEDTKTPIGCSDWDVAFSYSTYTIATGDAALAPEIVGTTYGAVHFESSNPSVLSVDEDGKVTAQAAGTATISAHWDGNETYCPKDMVSSLFTVTGTLVVTYDKNDGTLTPETKTQEVDYNEPVTLDANTFTRTGYTFQGWATTRDGSKVYNNQQSDVIFTETTTLYAVWGKKDYNVSFTPSPEGATVMVNSSSTSPQSAEYESTVTIAITPNVAYEIGSVTVTGDVSSNSISVSGEGNTRTFNMPAENVTVTVTMTAKTTYAIRFFNNGVQVGSTQNLYVGATATLPAAQTACEGYTFLGWWTETLSGSNTTAHTWITSNFTVSEAGNKDYYAVYSHVETSGGGGTSYKLVESLTNDKDYIFVTRNTAGDGYAFSSAITTGTAVTIATSGDDKIVSGTPANSIIWTVSSGLKLTTKDESKTDKVLKINGSSFTLDATGSNNLAWTTNYGLNGKSSSGSTKYYLQCTSDGTFSKSTTGSTTNRVWAYEKTSDSGSSTTYYTTMPDCEECLNKVTLTKGEESHGSFTLNKVNGAYDNCKADFVVTVSGITPDDGYYCTGVTATGEHVDVSGPDGSGNYTVTYTKGYSITSTITANFDLIPKYTVNWYVAGTPTPEEKYAGETLEGIGAPTSGDCDGVKVFKGWTAEPTYFNATDAPTDLFTDPTTKTMPVGGTNYYAVFATETTSEGSPTNVIEYDGSGMVTLEEIEGVTQNGVSTYAAGNAPYLLKFDGTGDYIQFALSAPPVSLSFNYKMLGGPNTSTMTIKECATIDGTYSSVEDLSISGAQNSTGTKTTSKSFAQKFIRMVFTKGSNVGVGAITIVGTGSSTTYSNYSTSCVTYTVTAVSNNDSWGTVSVDGYKVTASPAVGYIADSYTIIDGSFTAVQNGNIYSVVPTSDCTIQINFRKAAEYTVTLNDNNTSYTRTAYESTPFELPEEGLSACPDATFLGWVAGTYEGHAAGTPVAPTYLAPGSDVSVTEDDTQFTAVYGILVENASDKYAKISSIDQLTTGDYLIVANYSTTLREAMENAVSSGHMDESSVTITDDQITNTNTALIWRITKTGTNYTIYNDVKSQYLALSSSATVLQDKAHNFNAAVNEGNWVFESTTVSGYQLIYETYFKSLSSKGSDAKDIWLFKRQPKIDLYTSHPNCCYEPDEALAINCEVSTLIGSGSATLSLSGGNGKPVAWQCKDEADANCNSYLSGLVETEKTVTLHSAATTKTYTITAVQGDDETDPDHVICGATVSWTITVKAQFTITYKTIESGVESEHSTVIVTDGDSYTLPDISEEFDCGDTEKSFAGWASSSTATAVEKAAGATAVASGDATWYACWSTATNEETVDIYEEVTDISQITAGDKVIIASSKYWVAMSTQNDKYRDIATTYEVEDNDAQTYFLSTDGVVVFTLGGNETDGWTFNDGSGYLYACSSSSNDLKTRATNSDANGLWDITIGSSTSIVAKGSYTRNDIRHNNSSKRFSCYGSSTTETKVMLYRRTGETKSVTVATTSTVTTDHEGCTSDAVIRAKADQWITATKGQKVKRVYDVKAFGFESAATLTITGNTDSHFTATLGATDVPAAPAHLETTLTVEYLPTEANTTNITTITLSAGEVTKTLEVNGRSLPDEFLMITKKTLWYAVPANMTSGENQYEGVVVEPDDGIEPTFVPVAPSTIVYSLRSADNSRYDANGACVRLAGNNSKALWGNTTADAITIQNSETVDKANTENYEWLLNTTDGIHYTIVNPHHADFENGRVLAFGDKFGLYKEPSVFFLVPTGCNSQPQEVNVSARRADATFSWISNASSVTIDLYTDEEKTASVKSEIATSIPYYMDGLEESTPYWFKLTPNGEDDCAVFGEFVTTGPTIDIVEWEENAVVIFVDKDEYFKPSVIIEGEQEHGIGSGTVATDIFFSKYFEAEGDAKMLAIFNGTNNPISLADITILQRKKGGTSSYNPFSLAPYGKVPGTIQPGEEIILYNRDSRDAVMECAEDDPTFDTWNNVENPNLAFSGKGTIRLFRGNKCIDIIGAMKSDAAEGDIDDITKEPLEGATKPGWGDSEGFVVATGDNYSTKDVEEDDYGLSTNRCLLIRKAFVTSGDSAIWNNYGNFYTLGSYTGIDGKEHKGEWAGLQIATATDELGNKTFANTCAGFQEVGHFDYSEYYRDWNTIGEETKLEDYTHDKDTKTYEIPIPELAKYSCLNLRFQLTNDAHEVVTEAPVQVPIIVKGGHTTIDDIFNEIVKTDDELHTPLYDQSINRCKTCDVVVLSDGVLTKATDGATHDVPEVGNVKVYPGGKLIVPEGTSYSVSSLAFRRQEDAVATADIQGDLNIKAAGDHVYLDLRINPTNWHFMSLPYDCKVSDIRFADDIRIPILGTDYLLYWYDGERRAATRDDDAWEPVTADATLKKGLGYIFGLPGEGKVMRELRFPMSNDVIDEEDDDKTVGSVYGYGCDMSLEELRPNHRGWNLIGAPYLLNYSTDITTPLATGLLVEDHSTDPWDGKWTIEAGTEALRYIVEPINNGWDGYRQVPISEYPMLPFTCYFVQIGGTDPKAAQGVEFKAESVPRSSIVRRAPAEYAEDVEDDHPVWCGITLTNAKGEKDETTMLISNTFTNGYDIMNDLVKMRGIYYSYYSMPVLASRNDEGEMAFNALPDASAEAGIPLHFFASASGTYTFAMNEKLDSEEVKEARLLDKQNGQWYDLKADSYSFTTGRTDDKERFILSIRVERKKTPEISTDLDRAGYTEQPIKILHNGHIYILRGDKMYDITGKQMLNH